MEKKIKTLYILSIVAILAFLAMQGYWLYVRYEYTLQEYEKRMESVIERTLAEYNKVRVSYSTKFDGVTTVHSLNNLNMDVDSMGRQKRTATITTRVYNANELLGIKEKREFTKEEREKLSAMIVADSIAATDTQKTSVDVTSASSDGMAWNAMKNFEIEVQSPFSIEGIDSLLRKENIDAAIALVVTDSIMWKRSVVPHNSIIKPLFTMLVPYSELERKSVEITCRIPYSEVIGEMGVTLILAFILSLFLILCLIWQIKTIAKLTRLDKIRNSFITTMIHELKRPISTLKMCVSGIENGKLMEDLQLRYELIGEIRVALDNLSAYFSKLRDITFNNAEQIPLSVTTFKLRGLVDELLQSIVTPSTKSVAFENNVPEEFTVSADSSHFMNILTNLIENAIKYSGDPVTIRISAITTADGCSISVTDNGDGISVADKGKIFNRFYRGKAKGGDIPGMGLGLAYVRLLVEAHGGVVTVESDEGVGSTFTINIPQ